MIDVRWPLYIFEIAFGLAAIGLTIAVWRKRGRGWTESLIIVPWLGGSVIFAVYLLLQVAANGWQDIAPNRFNATVSNMLLVAGPASVLMIMVLRLWDTRG